MHISFAALSIFGQSVRKGRVLWNSTDSMGIIDGTSIAVEIPIVAARFEMGNQDQNQRGSGTDAWMVITNSERMSLYCPVRVFRQQMNSDDWKLSWFPHALVDLPFVLSYQGCRYSVASTGSPGGFDSFPGSIFTTFETSSRFSDPVGIFLASRSQSRSGETRKPVGFSNS